MRWDLLFADLEARFAAEERRALDGEVADRTRREHARLGLADRLRAAGEAPLRIGLGGAGDVSGRVLWSGPGWVLLDGGTAGEVVVVTAAVSWVSGLPGAAADPDGVGFVEQRMDLGHVLRGLSRDRVAATLVLRDGGQLRGVVQRVGADHLDLAAEPERDRHRGAAGAPVRTVPVDALALLRLA